MRKGYVVDCKGKKLILGPKTRVMGILNVTPDSFSDAGLFYAPKKAISHGIEMAEAGADIIDVGGESTRPGALSVPAKEQIRRIVPVISGLRKKFNALISVDTSSAEVAREAINAGADIVNDISGLRADSRLAEVIARHRAACIVMHIKGAPRTMQKAPRYKNLIREICARLKDSINIAKRAGVSENRIIVDPGIGFGKTVRHNLDIIKNLSILSILNKPVLIGVSRKSFIGKVLNLPPHQFSKTNVKANWCGGVPPEERLIGTIASCTVAIVNGAHIIRAHDVKEAAQAARLTDAILFK